MAVKSTKTPEQMIQERRAVKARQKANRKTRTVVSTVPVNFFAVVKQEREAFVLKQAKIDQEFQLLDSELASKGMIFLPNSPDNAIRANFLKRWASVRRYRFQETESGLAIARPKRA
jgi:hypothetical protein